MSKSILRYVLPLGGAALLSLSAAIPAQASQDDAYYRCHVVGESQACAGLPAPAMNSTTTRLVPGSYGQYLVFLGESNDQAIADARARGEQPKEVITQAAPRHYTSAEAYERYLGNL